jgi:hypothetical protein
MSKDDIIVRLTKQTDKTLDLVHDDPHYYFGDYKKINIYNKKIKIPLQKIWIKTPKLKVFAPVLYIKNAKKNIPLTFILSPNSGDIATLYTFIKRVERKCGVLVKTITGNKKLKPKSILKQNDGFDPLMTVRMPLEIVGDCYEFGFNVYNHMNKRVSIRTIESGIQVSSFLELTDIWYNEETLKYGFNWNVVQMKIYPEMSFAICLFDDDADKYVLKDEKNECYHCLYCPNAHIRTHVCNNSGGSGSIPLPPPPLPITTPVDKPKYVRKEVVKPKPKTVDAPMSFMVSQNDLLNIRAKLKATGKREKKEYGSDFYISEQELVNMKTKLVKVV